MRVIAIAVMGTLTLSACATPELEDTGSPNRPLAVDLLCPTGPGVLRVSTTPVIARQGESLTLNAAMMRAPGGGEPLDLACLVAVRVTPATAARWDAAQGQVIVLPDAPPGTIVTVSTGYRDNQATHEFRVVGRDEVVLTGTWRQDAVKCEPGRAPGEPVRELKFTDSGRFNATYQPFESYVDYWGTVTFDAATGAIALTPDGGNFTPPLLDVEGTARLDSPNRLILENVYLGARNEQNPQPRTNEKGELVRGSDGQPILDQPSCRYEFVR
ncbi:hypothetical protein [Brevundimonas sp.]|uniref:hypothetical protein n=1 Tax=Brevundimonas sp. TaxID=1871086 RepID=UPI00260A6A6E|nr:hypothetical protein [Brevundimonas sp.]